MDCAKRRFKWMLADFYGRGIMEPTTVEHSARSLKAMPDYIGAVVRTYDLRDSIVAHEVTGIYHHPPRRAFRKVGFDKRGASVCCEPRLKLQNVVAHNLRAFINSQI